MAKVKLVNKDEFESVGFLDFGNNDCWEVYCPKVLPPDTAESFVINNFPVYLASHDSIETWAPLSLFLAGTYLTTHIVEIVRQLGLILDTYIKERSR